MHSCRNKYIKTEILLGKKIQTEVISIIYIKKCHKGGIMQALHVTLTAAVLYVSSVHSICQKCLLVRAKATTYYCTNSSHRIVACAAPVITTVS